MLILKVRDAVLVLYATQVALRLLWMVRFGESCICLCKSFKFWPLVRFHIIPLLFLCLGSTSTSMSFVPFFLSDFFCFCQFLSGVGETQNPPGLGSFCVIFGRGLALRPVLCQPHLHQGHPPRCFCFIWAVFADVSCLLVVGGGMSLSFFFVVSFPAFLIVKLDREVA